LVPDHFKIKKREKLVEKFLQNATGKEIPAVDHYSVDDDDDDDDDDDSSSSSSSSSSSGSNSDSSSDDQDEDPFPSALIDLFYLLADYYFKNSEFTQAIQFYRIDLSWNKQRIDSWVPLALSLANSLEQKVNEMAKVNECSSKTIEMSNESVKQILAEAEAIMKCFRNCIQLSPRSTTVRIESANFAYTMVSFCTRQLGDDNVESLSMDLFTLIEKLKPAFMAFAVENYDMALTITDEKYKEGSMDIEESNEHDERWLIYMMKGKILEKQKKEPQESLSLYIKAVDNLLSQGAIVPKRINFNSPPDLALELLEVYYCIHASTLKLEFTTEDSPLDLNS
jgi:calcineurin-binding protein cabin-1